MAELTLVEGRGKPRLHERVLIEDPLCLDGHRRTRSRTNEIRQARGPALRPSGDRLPCAGGPVRSGEHDPDLDLNVPKRGISDGLGQNREFGHPGRGDRLRDGQCSIGAGFPQSFDLLEVLPTPTQIRPRTEAD